MKKLIHYLYIITILFFSPIPYAKTHVITIGDNYFKGSPQLNIVTKDTIKFENDSNRPITLNFEYINSITYNPANFNSNTFYPGSSFEYTFVNAAQLSYSEASNTDLKGGIGVYEKPLLISPRDSTLLAEKELNVTVFYQYENPLLPSMPADRIRSHIALTLDKKIIYDGNFEGFLKSPLVSEVGNNDEQLNRYFILKAPPNSLSLGKHIFRIISKDSSIIYDEVQYTIR
ncbi:MAG: hypothetical protein HOP02_04220 [Methylococcaceae bacterium]|nr:hypothetical protein [Methylococcaceae bacterium]